MTEEETESSCNSNDRSYVLVEDVQRTDTGDETCDSCCICFEDGDEEFVLTSCCHLFCLPCITKWIEISGTCPICRNDFEAGVELYDLNGTVESTIKAIKELHKWKQELGLYRREEEKKANQKDAPSWGILHQVMGLLFPGATEGSEEEDRLKISELEQDRLAQLHLTRAYLQSQRSQQNVALARGLSSHSFSFLHFCCLPQSAAPADMDRMPLRNRIH